MDGATSRLRLDTEVDVLLMDHFGKIDFKLMNTRYKGASCLRECFTNEQRIVSEQIANVNVELHSRRVPNEKYYPCAARNPRICRCNDGGRKRFNGGKVDQLESNISTNRESIGLGTLA